MAKNKTTYNKSRLEALKTGYSNRLQKKSDFKTKLRNTKQRLLPQQPQNKSEDNYNKLLQKMQEDYNKKIDGLKKEYNNRAKADEDRFKKSDSELQNLQKRLEDSTERFNSLTNYLSNKEKQENQRAKEQAEQASESQGEAQPEAQGETPTQAPTSFENLFNNNTAATPKIVENKTAATTKEKAEKDSSPAITIEEDENIVINEDGSIRDKNDPILQESATSHLDKNGFLKQNKLKIGQRLQVGDNYYSVVTNTFGLRVGKNSVPGREGEHSRGIDIVTFTKNGKVRNIPMSFADGVIVNIGKQGSGKKMTTLEGKSGGYYVDVRVGDKILRYAHLPASVMNMNLLNTKVERGKPLFVDKDAEAQGVYELTGSGTGPHNKLLVYDVDSNGKATGNPASPSNDPTRFVIYGA